MGTIYLIANTKPEVVPEHPVLVALGLIILIVVFYLLPVWALITKTEIIVDKRILTVKSYPPIRQKAYPLRDLIEWQLKEGYGRYGSYTHLYLKFSTKESLEIYEREVANFDLLIKYLDSDYRRIKRIKGTTVNTTHSRQPVR